MTKIFGGRPHKSEGALKYLWLLYLPLLYLPNLGFAKATTFGTLEFSDYLIGPYIALLLFSIRKRNRMQVDFIIPILCLFFLWATLSTLLIDFRYGYSDSHFIIFGMLKLFKMTLYGLAGILTIKALNQRDKKIWYNWSLLACAIFVSVSLVMSIGTTGEISSYHVMIDQTITGYKASNVISAMMAMLLCSLAGLWITRQGSSRWLRAMVFAFVFIIAGFTLSQGRGGWIAALAGLLYLLYKIRINRRVFISICALFALCFAAYHYFPNFSYEVDKTLYPDQYLMERYQYGIFGVDEGGRLRYFLKEASKMIKAPVFGTGFFHRGFEFSKSSLDEVGSHNFWLQMFLETGIVGGGLVLLIFWRMWRQAVFLERKGEKLAIAVQSAFVAAFVGGMSGEYFYGGIALFTLFIVYAPIGSLPYKKVKPQVRLLFSNLKHARQCPDEAKPSPEAPK